MEALASELRKAITEAKSVMVEVQGTKFERYLSGLVTAGETALGELETRSVADLNELIAALNEGARATVLTLGSQSVAQKMDATGAGLVTLEVETEPQAEVVAETEAMKVTVKAEAVSAQTASRSLETVAQVETQVAEIATTAGVTVPNTSAGLETMEVSAVPGAWGTMTLVLIATAVAGAIASRKAKCEIE